MSQEVSNQVTSIILDCDSSYRKSRVFANKLTKVFPQQTGEHIQGQQSPMLSNFPNYMGSHAIWCTTKKYHITPYFQVRAPVGSKSRSGNEPILNQEINVTCESIIKNKEKTHESSIRSDRIWRRRIEEC